MELSKYLREEAKKIEGKQQLLVSAFAKALEIIPRQLCDNAGIDATDILNKLRQKHSISGKCALHLHGNIPIDLLDDGRWYGVDINSGSIGDNFKSFVWEPSVVKINMISAAVEAACLVLSIDETVKNQQSQQPGAGAPGGMMPQMGQRPGAAMMQPGMRR
jgi:T-complex protein 1 subunit eta